MARPVITSPYRQRGATLIFTAFFLLALVATVGLAVEVGRLYAAQSELQSVANSAALNAVRAVSGCSETFDPDPDNLDQQEEFLKKQTSFLIQQTIDGNDTGGTQISLSERTLGNLVSPATLREFTVDFTGVDVSEANAVRVTLERAAPDPLIGLFTAGNQLSATAAAAQTPVGGISVGSRVANVNTQQAELLNGLLGQMLGTSLNLNALDFADLVQLNLTLLDLVNASAQAANVEDLVGLTLSPGDLLQLAGDAAPAGMAANILNTIGSTIPTAANPPIDNLVGNLLGLEAGAAGAAAHVPLNALGLVTALAQTSANQRNEVIELGSGLTDGLLSTLSLLPGVDIDLDIELGVVEAPQLSGVGRPGYDKPDTGQFTNANGSTNDGARTWASTSQVHLNLDAHVSLNLLLVSLDVNLPIYVEVGAAHAILADIDCADAANRLHRAHVVTQPSVVQVGLGHFDNIFDPNPQPIAGGNLLNLDVTLLIIPIHVLTLPLPPNGLQVSADSGEHTVHFDGPFVPQIPEPSDANTATLNSDVGTSVGSLLGSLIAGVNSYVIEEQPFQGLVGGILNAVTALLHTLGVGTLLDLVGNLLQSLLSALDTVLNPLLDGLGVTAGSAEVTVTSVIGDRPTLICTSAAACEAISVQ